MKRSGTADLRLSGGAIPPWLFNRMKQLSLPIVESILQEYGHKAFLSKLSNPYWFQSFGAVIGMDWNSSGVTTAIMSALKASLNPHASDLGIYICGGKGKESLKTPQELIRIGDKTGMDGLLLSQHSKLSAKIDNTALQDGFNLYLHNFILSKDGDWSVIQQGMQPKGGLARRYHWHSADIKSFIENPHSAVCGENQGQILNLVHTEASETRNAIISLSQEKPEKLLAEVPHMKLPTYAEVRSKDVDIKRLGAVLWLAQEQGVTGFEDLLLLKGLGPRTLQTLTLVSEVIHGTPSRFSDPARFSFSVGGKAAKPFPVLTKVYDETILEMQKIVDQSKIGHSDKAKAVKSLSKITERAEKGFVPKAGLEELIQKENAEADQYGARRVQYKKKDKGNQQMNLFE